jgi:PAS domain S-box-containing protein
MNTRQAHEIGAPIAQAWKGALLVGLAATAYFASARVGYAFSIPQGVVTLWPPSGIMLGLLVMSPKREWKFLLLGGLIGSLLSDWRSGYPLGLALAAAVANGTETLVASLVLTKLVRTPVGLSDLRSVMALTIGAAIVSNGLTAWLGAAMLSYGFGTAPTEAWFVWWIGDGLGMLIVAPVVITWTAAAKLARHFGPRRLLEALALGAGLAGAAFIAFGLARDWPIKPGPYVTFPFLFWAALRFGPAGAATACLILAAIATWRTALGHGPYAAGSGPNAAMQVYAFLGLASLSSLIPAAALQERHVAVQRLRESRERYRTVVETATDAIITIDRESRIEFANPATERIFGYAPQELIGRELTVLMPAEQRPRHKEALRRYLDTRQKSFSWQAVALTGRHKDGHEIPLEVSFGELVDGGRHVFTGILRDITDKRATETALGKLEEQYRQSQKMEAIGLLAGGVAHDFNNLLTAILGYTTLVTEALDVDSPHREDLGEIKRAAEHATALTQQLLAFSRRQILAPRVIDLSDVLRRMEPMLRRLIGEHIEVIVRTPTSIGQIRADPGQIEQVVLNLAVNARDAMPDGGTLLIELADVTLDESYARRHVEAAAGPYVMLAVSDTGIGIAPETAARIFEPFFTTKPKGVGTGLGLSTVHGIVKQSGGSVWVYSEPGRGTTFKVYLPRVDDIAEPDRSADAIVAPPRRGSGTILIVEDADGVRRLAARVLEQEGYQVLIAATPTEGLEIAARHAGPIHLLLSDVVLPEISGRVLAERLLADRPGLRVLYMSGYTDDVVVHRGILNQEMPFLQKPFTPESLLRKVRDLI